MKSHRDREEPYMLAQRVKEKPGGGEGVAGRGGVPVKVTLRSSPSPGHCVLQHSECSTCNLSSRCSGYSGKGKTIS